ncbi:hypothetical protein NFIA_038830 [Paecilomyces variotii No. 5]|uniref:Hydrophobin n=1 Tax=Byssochlamys spectabilis (strain No. 5 / NBRC 109023) TaxID=1356009 RepID=V5FNM3_BYSSN|nr:hypothetical protein NFIA_038830 [Paecilomyces variotii No. 5]
MRVFSNLLVLAATATTLVSAAPPSLKNLPSQVVENLLPTPSVAPSKISKCPADAKKQCCVTLQEASKALLSNLGELVPYLSGVQIGSVVGMGCMDMQDDSPDYDCQDTVACCSGAELLGAHTLTGGFFIAIHHGLETGTLRRVADGAMVTEIPDTAQEAVEDTALLAVGKEILG